MDDTRIVDLYLQRNESAIRESAEKYGARLRFLADGIVCDRQTAEECENDTYLNACRSRRALKRSAAICRLSAEMEQCLPVADQAQSRLDAAALTEAINRFLGSLDPEKRNLFVRRYWYLDSVAELAARFSLSQSKVKTTLFRCRTGLREHLEKEGYRK